MPKIILDLGFLKVSASYLQRRSSGRLYYYRRIPKDLRGHYRGKQFRLESLKTTDERAALKKVATLAARDDAFWASLKAPLTQDAGLTTPEVREAAKALLSQWGLEEGAGHRTGPEAHRQVSDVVDIIDAWFIEAHGSDYERARKDDWYATHVRHPDTFLTPVQLEARRLVLGDPSRPRVLLSDALKHYLENRPKTPSLKFIGDATAYIARAKDAVGDLPLTDYRREHAHKVRDHLSASGLATTSVRRALNSISAIFNHGLREFDLGSHANPFKSLPIAGEGEDTTERETFTPEELKAIEAACRLKDDDIRHVVALQANTGARISEIVGLRIEDMSLDHNIPHIYIRAYESLGRTLKNDNNERRVPLVGISLWAAERLMSGHEHRKVGWLVPRYAKDTKVKGTYASNTINKWLRTALKIDKTTHSFRHTMRDRLRHVEAPEEIQDAIGGWKSQGSVGRTYGQGHTLAQLQLWTLKAVQGS